jgi:NAD(P)-dependent dehydrogenase (short-subunit alcohol dehydrogenase family)
VADVLHGRVALVAGGGRGAGRAIVEALHAQGAAVVIADNGTGPDGLGADPRVAGELVQALGPRAAAFTESIASPSAAAAAVALAVKRFGGLDILVNGAAIRRDASVSEGDPAAWDAVIRNNLSAAYYLIAAAAPRMRAAGETGRGGGQWGRIVNIVSMAGLSGSEGQAADGSAKAGLVALSRIAALELARDGITSNAVVPVAATRMAGGIEPADGALSPEHVATFVAYLCSPAAQGVSGQLFAVRRREVLLFSQPRPVARLTGDADWTPESLAAAIEQELSGHFVPLATDLGAFDRNPVT